MIAVPVIIISVIVLHIPTCTFGFDSALPLQDKTIKAYPLDTVLLLNKCEKPSDPAALCSTMFEEFNTASLKNKVDIHVQYVLYVYASLYLLATEC